MLAGIFSDPSPFNANIDTFVKTLYKSTVTFFHVRQMDGFKFCKPSFYLTFGTSPPLKNNDVWVGVIGRLAAPPSHPMVPALNLSASNENSTLLMSRSSRGVGGRWQGLTINYQQRWIFWRKYWYFASMVDGFPDEPWPLMRRSNSIGISLKLWICYVETSWASVWTKLDRWWASEIRIKKV